MFPERELSETAFYMVPDKFSFLEDYNNTSSVRGQLPPQCRRIVTFSLVSIDPIEAVEKLVAGKTDEVEQDDRLHSPQPSLSWTPPAGAIRQLFTLQFNCSSGVNVVVFINHSLQEC